LYRILEAFTTTSDKTNLEKNGILLCKKIRGENTYHFRSDSKRSNGKVQGKKVSDQSNGAFHDRLELDDEDAN